MRKCRCFERSCQSTFCAVSSFWLFKRRLASSNKHEPPLKRSLKPTTEMGVNASKAADSGPDTNRKSLRPRSSFNILQRTRTPSASTRVNSRTTEVSGQRPAYVSVDGTGPSGNVSGDKDDVAHASRPSSAAISVPCDSTVGSDKGSRSSYSTSSTATPATTTEETEETSVDEESSDSSRHATPVPIPRITLPTTFVLPEDSPTKYGLRTAQTPSPELSLSQAQRMKMSPGALFQVRSMLCDYRRAASDSSLARRHANQSS